MKVELKGKELVITIPINETPSPSASGKSLVVATSGGNKQTEVKVKGKFVTVGLNAYISNK